MATPAHKSLRILFADDERSLQELMKLEIPRMGHRVTVCPDGLTAAAALEKENFDCILVDLDMPGLNGIEVIAKAKELSPDVEAIVLTGKSSLDTAIALCDMFLPEGLTIVETRGRDNEVYERITTTGKGRFQNLPPVVLVNQNSASASEIVAACLQDHGRAAVAGQRSYGKGTVQKLIPVESGHSLLKLTAASYWRPSGKNIHRTPNAKDTDPWGVMVEMVEMKDVEIPTGMQRAMAREAEAIREKRARIIKAEAELEASYKLASAAETITQNPMSLELRRMQMISEVGAEQNTTTIIMMPSEFVTLARGLAPTSMLCQLQVFAVMLVM